MPFDNPMVEFDAEYLFNLKKRTTMIAVLKRMERLLIKGWTKGTLRWFRLPGGSIEQSHLPAKDIQ